MPVGAVWLQTSMDTDVERAARLAQEHPPTAQPSASAVNHHSLLAAAVRESRTFTPMPRC